jgi:uncharacterized cupredoxin-like copper-binding protein
MSHMAHFFRPFVANNGAMRKLTTLILILTSLVIVTACSSDDATQTTPEPKALTLVATDIAFDVERVEAIAGQPITLTLDNQGVLEHDFSIMEIPVSGEVTTTEHAEESDSHDMSQLEEQPAVHVAAPAGEHSTIEFIPSAPGEYAFYCTVSGHREAGMEGVLVVE